MKLDFHKVNKVTWLRKAVEWVEEQENIPEIDREWDQTVYVQEPQVRALTLLARANVQFTAGEIGRLRPHCNTAYCVAGYLGQLLDKRYARATKVNNVHVAAFVSRKLGLTETEARHLFAGGNTAADVRRIAESIAGEPL